MASSWSLWDVQVIWCAVIGFNWKWRNTSPLHVFSAVSWSARFFGKGKSICIKFLHGRRRKKLLSKFRTKSSVNTSIASRFHPTGVTALKSRAASKHKSLPSFLTAGIIAFDLCSHIKPIAYLIVGCMPKQIETQSPLWQRSSRVRTS